MSQETAIASFKKFQESWIEQLRHHLNHLRSAQNHHRNSATGDEELLREAVERVMEHFREYHRAKWATTEKDVIGVMAAPWSSLLNGRSIGSVVGDQPPCFIWFILSPVFCSSLVSLIYFVAFVLVISAISLLLSSGRTVSELQCETVKEENAITEEISEWQDDASELVMGTSSDPEQRIRCLAEIVHRTDDLRLRTITRVVELLSPLQQAEFLIAAAELRTGVAGWGTSHDRRGSSNV